MFFSLALLNIKFGIISNKSRSYWILPLPEKSNLFLLFFPSYPIYFLEFLFSSTGLAWLVCSSSISEKVWSKRKILSFNSQGWLRQIFLRVFTQISKHFCAYKTIHIDLFWVSFEKSFPTAEFEYNWCLVWSKMMTSEI